MLTRFVTVFLLILTPTLWAQESETPEPVAGTGPDLVIWGGPIYTGGPNAETVEAVVVQGGVIRYVGPRVDAQAMISPQTTVLDLAGAALYPGFVDGHAHLSGVGAREIILNVKGAQSLEALLSMVSDWMATYSDPVIIGHGWLETHWPEGRFPSRWDLDRVAKDRPVILIRADGHALVANSAAMTAAGIDGNTPVPDGGAIHVNGVGEATGMLVDNAMGLMISELVPPRGPDRIREELQVGARVYAERGWTGLHNMSVPWNEVELMTDMANSGDIAGIRIYNSVTEESAPTLFDAGRTDSLNGRVITRAVKLYVDGALGSRGAALLAPYADADTTGLLTLQKDRARALMTRALRSGIQINSHAIGDRANRLLLDWVEAAYGAVPAAERPVVEPRFRNEHAQIVNPLDIPRFSAVGLIPSMQPSHAIGDLYFAPARLGDDRLNGAYAWRSMIDAGSIIVGGSDAPVEQGSPLIEFYAAVARRDLEGNQGEDWRAQEVVSREEALKMFTLWPAIASFQEDRLGTIAVGKRADFTAFTVDLMTADPADILTADALLTVVDGEIVFVLEGDETEEETVAAGNAEAESSR